MIPDFSTVIIQPYYRYTQLVIEIKIFQGDGDTRVGRVNGFSMVISLGRRRSFRDGEKLTGLEAYASQDRCLGCNEARLGEAR